MSSCFLNFVGDSICTVTPLPHKQHPKDKSFAEEMFSLDIAVSSLVIPGEVHVATEAKHHESWIYEADTEVVEEATFLVERYRLLGEASGPYEVAALLDDVQVPRRCQGFMVPRILGCAREMAKQVDCLGRKVLHIRVSIDLAPAVEDDVSFQPSKDRDHHWKDGREEREFCEAHNELVLAIGVLADMGSGLTTSSFKESA